MQRSYIREILDLTTASTISFAGGLPDPTLFPTEALKDAADAILRRAEVLQYGRSQGRSTLREKIAARYSAAGFTTHADQILITTGSQQALNLIAVAFLKRGVTVEVPSYLGALGVFRLYGAPVHGVALRRDGIDVDALKQGLKQTGAAYLIPDFQNPTGGRYTLPRRHEAVEALLASGAVLIEDAAYSELYFDVPSPSLSHLMPEQSFHIGSFSKILSPGLRVGWIRADVSKIRQLLAVKEVMDLHTSTLTQHLIDHFWQTHGLEAHLQMLRRTYRTKMAVMAKALRAEIPELVFEEPDGGMFLYGAWPGVDTRELARRCMAADVAIVPGREFYGSDGPEDEMRLCFTGETRPRIQDGVGRLAQCSLPE